MTRWLFDVDGTLTDSRQKIDPEFHDFMLDFVLGNKVAFVTGSDRAKTVEQIGEELFDRVEYSFNCAGNEIWMNGVLFRKNTWAPTQELIDYLTKLIDHSKFPTKTGNHIEIRNGMMNFSVTGRNGDLKVRKDYIDWDKATNERMNLREKIEHKFDNIDVFVGGDTGLDLYPKGKNKEQVIDFLNDIEKEKTYYFGDQIFRYGNDYNIAMKCNHRYAVRGWRDTYEILSYLKEVDYCL